MHCCAMMSWSDKACSFSDCRMWSTCPSWHEAACQDVHPTTGSAACELDERLAPGFCLTPRRPRCLVKDYSLRLEPSRPCAAPLHQSALISPYLGVLVDEEQGVGHVVVSQVDHRRSHPAANALLTPGQNAPHGPPH